MAEGEGQSIAWVAVTHASFSVWKAPPLAGGRLEGVREEKLWLGCIENKQKKNLKCKKEKGAKIIEKDS